MSAVRDGPEMKFTARGSTPRSARSNAHASSMPRTMRPLRTTAIWVSGRRLVVAGVRGPDKVISVPVSAIAQNAPVMPTRSEP